MLRVFLSVLLGCSLASSAFGQTQWTQPGTPIQRTTWHPHQAQPSSEQAPASVPAMPVCEPPPTTNYTPGDGLTVSMLNGTSKLKLFAQLSVIGVASTDRPFVSGVPFLLLPGSPTGLSTNTFDLHARQSAFGASFSGPEVCGFTPGAFFLAFIQNDSLSNDAYGLLPYQAYGELKNESWRIAGGLQSDVFNPVSPTIISLAKLYGSGNTGSFRGQFRVENFLKPSDEFQLTTQVAISEPISTVIAGNRRILEDNGWPNIEARIEAGLGPVEEIAGGRKQRAVTVGVSGFVGEIRTSRSLLSPVDPEVPNRAVIGTYGAGVDGQWAVTDRFGVAGELFVGQGLGEYNGGILQIYNDNFRVIRSRGGWGEVYYYFTDSVHLHTGYGIDAPIQRDVGPFQFAKNQTAFANLIWDVSKVLQISVEVDYRKTEYLALRDAEGVLVLTQMLWRF